MLLSGGCFVLRGLLVQFDRRAWAMAAPLRHASYSIDTVLLVAGLLMVSNLPAAAFGNGWLAAKLLLLPVYVLLGWRALHGQRSAARRIGYCCAAALVYLTMITIARAHHPLGWLHWLAGN